ncbi:MAG TPA: arsinothricin resistance N-acetyltransferase ArsN1 family B [Gemmataceae bacterium]|nr:arsinothricin resistance N-acetyltransferase ArsN1 family B [Gemmataceae bacterium]
MPPTIRLAVLDDAEQVQAVYAPYCHTPISFESQPPTVLQMRDRLANVLGQYPWLVCEDGGEVLGYAYASRHRERAAYRWSIDATVYIRQGRQRRGLGRALYTSLFALLPLQGYVAVCAGVTLPNPASVGLHEAMGFQLVGVYRSVGYKYGAWYDVAWFQRLLQTPPSQPPEPKAIGQFRASSEWQAALTAGLPLLRGMEGAQ